MNADKIAAVAGTLGLVHGGFSHAEDTHHTQMGATPPADHKGTVRAPLWSSLGAIAIGVRQLFGGRKR